MIIRSELKKSDQKQYDKAWAKFHSAMDALVCAVMSLQDLTDYDFTVDDLNQFSMRIEKLATTLTRIRESINK